MQEFYNYKFREEGLSPKTLRNYHMALHKCLQQAVKERLLVYNPCDAVTLPSGEKPEIVVFTNDQQRALVQASYRHRYGVFIRLDLCTGLRMGELLALKWEDIDFSVPPSFMSAVPSTALPSTKPTTVRTKPKSYSVHPKRKTPAARFR